jgi:uncharacterized protein
VNPDYKAEAVPPVISPALYPPIIPSPLEEAPARERIESLDVLRGFAILGILIMNIQGFAMIEAAYINPMAYGDFTGVNRWVWFLGHVFADQKFLTIFSLLFGAGIALFAQKLQSLGKPAGWLHYKRMFWLLVFGLLHANLFWHGDILISYSLIGCVAFLFRNLRPGWLAFWGGAAQIVPFLIFLGAGYSMPFWPAEAIESIAGAWQPDEAVISAETEALRGGILDQLAFRLPMAFMLQFFLLFLWTGWRTGGLMLLGMALLKWSVLSGRRPARLYVGMVITGAGFGLPLILYGVYRNFQEEWSVYYSYFIGSQWNYWGSLGMVVSYIGLVMLAQQGGALAPIRRVLAAIGRMALSNYLFQTLVCTTIFYGHGLGWFGHLERWELVLVVLTVWSLQVLLTLAWLRRFPQGPFEWLWRSLTYWRLRSRTTGQVSTEPGPSGQA